METKRTFFLKKSAMHMLRALSCFLFLLCSIEASAQTTVRGVVTDANGEYLIGVQVQEKGAKQGVSTDANGKFNIAVSNRNAVLTFRYVGYKNHSVALNGKTNVNVMLEEDAKALDEVVVVGYGSQKKQHVTGSVAQLNADEILKAPSGNVSGMLVGRMPGLVAQQKSGQPGADGSNLLIRGVSTLGTAAPMVIVDDVQRSFNNLDPNEIESITILKDASSAAVYGMQAAGGVILVKTKRGSMQRPRITYSGKLLYSQNTNYPKFLNGPDFIKWFNKALEMDGKEPLFTEEVYNKVLNGDPEGKYANTDWFSELMKNGATTTHHNISVNGGNETAKYFAFYVIILLFF